MTVDLEVVRRSADAGQQERLTLGAVPQALLGERGYDAARRLHDANLTDPAPAERGQAAALALDTFQQRFLGQELERAALEANHHESSMLSG
jgi:hypothetical protein